ncbi:MAG TPA: alkaline phosphatase D family protein [Planctomycetota bacterium]|nr:alkaline phosphatase D family protein [Planctomycetota bacterium]
MAALLLALLLQAETRQATGVKIGEVTDTSALVWMRVTAKAAREADGSCPGAPGRVRLRYGTKEDLSDARTTDWVAVREAEDFAAQLALRDLAPATVHHYAAETEGHGALRGRFETAPRADAAAEVGFTVITGQAYKDLDDPAGFLIYEAMAKLRPRFLVPTGDTVYYDNDPPLAATPALARLHWQRMYSLPRHVAFHLQVPAYWEKDDHDLIWNDCWPGMTVDKRLSFTFAEGQRLFREQVPAPATLYRTVRWGKALQVWFVEGRDFRSPNNAPDGPAKTIWGAEQKEWLKRTLLESDADWKVLVSPTPIVGPDRGNKGDNHANAAFATEGAEMRRWFGEKLPKNFFAACGDRHWQYHSVDPATGVQEFSCGPASDKHAGGSPGKQEMHRFHRMKGGFLSVTASREAIAFRLHDVRGDVVHEHKQSR